MKEKPYLIDTFISNIQIQSNSNVILQGVKGILQYDNDFIKVAFNKFNVIFYGTDLSISCFSQDNMEVNGKLERLEFV